MDRLDKIKRTLEKSIVIKDKMYDITQNVNEINTQTLIKLDTQINRASVTKAWKVMCLMRRFNEQFLKGSRLEKKNFIRWSLNKILKKPIIKDQELARFSPIEKFEIAYVDKKQIQNLHIDLNEMEDISDIKNLQKIANECVEGVDIFRFPVIEWNFRWQRPQQISSEFSKNNHRVFYFSIETLALNNPNLGKEDIADQLQIQILQQNVWWVKLCSNNFLNAYKNTINDEIDLKYLQWSIDHLKKKFSIKSSVSILDLPYWAPLALSLDNNKVIYDCMDDHAGFSTNSSDMLSSEGILINKADVVVTSSKRLYDKMHRKNNNVKLIRNAGEFEHFSVPPKKLAGEFENLEGPVIGYYGAISEWFDIRLIENLAKRNKNWTFVLVGDTFGCDTSTAENIENIIFTGEKPYKDLPKYLYGFDVCIIPFLINELTMSTNPVKVYEYLAAGKPVVSTKLPELEIIGEELVHLANSCDEFERKIRECLNGRKQDIEKRKQFAKENTWLARYKDFKNIVENEFYPLVSIVIVTFNNWNFTKQCLESLFNNNTYPNTEYIIVDNASSDETRLELSKLKHPRLKLIFSPKNLGFSGGNSLGCQSATGKYIILLNNDTILTENWIERLIRPLNENSEIGMVGPVSNSVGNDQMLDFFQGTSQNGPDVEWLRDFYYFYDNKMRHTNLLGFYCVAIRREVYDKVGDLDTAFGIGMFEDDDYCERVLSLGYKLAIIEDAFVYHHGSVSFKKLDDEKYRNLFEKNKSYFEEKWKKKWSLPKPPSTIFYDAVDAITIREKIKSINKKTILVLGDTEWTTKDTLSKEVVRILSKFEEFLTISIIYNYHSKELVGIRKIAPTLYFSNRTDLFEKTSFDYVIYCGQTDFTEFSGSQQTIIYEDRLSEDNIYKIKQGNKHVKLVKNSKEILNLIGAASYEHAH
ncbi:hypothetical protein GCM10023310_01830 [Paenibacillus vulneris]|uniref:Glycosyltransferase n=1 Tax=Paenibacillus vulneris TaxID=1133364 RepID=A0ABW3UEF3_9BACL